MPEYHHPLPRRFLTPRSPSQAPPPLPVSIDDPKQGGDATLQWRVSIKALTSLQDSQRLVRRNGVAIGHEREPSRSPAASASSSGSPSASGLPEVFLQIGDVVTFVHGVDKVRGLLARRCSRCSSTDAPETPGVFLPYIYIYFFFLFARIQRGWCLQCC